MQHSAEGSKIWHVLDIISSAWNSLITDFCFQSLCTIHSLTFDSAQIASLSEVSDWGSGRGCFWVTWAMSGIAVTCWTIRLTLSELLEGQGGVFISASPVPHNLWIKLNRTVIFLFILWQGSWDWTSTIVISSDSSTCYFSFIVPNTHHLALLYLSCFYPAGLNRWHIGRDRANKYEWVEITWQRVSFPSKKAAHFPLFTSLGEMDCENWINICYYSPVYWVQPRSVKPSARNGVWGMLKTAFLPASPPTITSVNGWSTHSSQVITTSKSHWVGSRMAIVKVFELVSWIRPMKAAWFLSWEKQGVRKWVWMATYPFYRWNHYSGRWSNLARITQLVKVNIFHRALGRRKLRGAYVTPGRGLAPKGT